MKVTHYDVLKAENVEGSVPVACWEAEEGLDLFLHKSVCIDTIAVGDVVPVVATKEIKYFVNLSEIISAKIVALTAEMVECEVLVSPSRKIIGIDKGERFSILRIQTQYALSDLFIESDCVDSLIGTVIVIDTSVPEESAIMNDTEQDGLGSNLGASNWFELSVENPDDEF